MYYYNYNDDDDDEISHDEISHVHVHVDPLTSYLLTYSTLSCASCICSTSCASVAATPTCTGSGANNRGTECATSALLFDGIARGGARTVLTHGAPLPQPIEYGAVARREGLEVLGWQSVCIETAARRNRGFGYSPPARPAIYRAYRLAGRTTGLVFDIGGSVRSASARLPLKRLRGSGSSTSLATRPSHESSGHA